MGTQKLLLRFGAGTVIGHVVGEVRRSAVAQVTVVVGADAGALTAALAGEDVAIVRNPDPDGDMLSSVRCGLRALPKGCTAVLIALGDQPAVSTGLVARLLAAYRTGGRGIVVPAFGGRTGHPLLFAARYREEVLTCHDARGLRGLLEAHRDDVFAVEVPDPSVLADMDTPADYQRELARSRDPERRRSEEEP